MGTAFNVRFFESSKVDVTVTEGRVRVVGQQPGSPELPALSLREPVPALLAAGEGLQYSELGVSAEPQLLDNEALSRKLAWQTGSLVFKGEPLSTVVKEISRYTDKQLIITDGALASLAVGGRYRTDDIDRLLVSLAEVMKIDIEYVSDDKIHLSSKK